MKVEKKTRSVVEIIKEYAAAEKVNLPVFPGVAFELQQLLADDNTSIEQVANVISKDQSLATQVLRLANSALFSGPTKIRTIRDAIMRLGLNHVFNLVICTSQQNLYKSSNASLDKYLQVSWKHALCTAVGSKWLIKELGYRELRDEAFLAGLLHDIGKLVLIKVFEVMNSKNEDLVFSDAFVSKVFASMHSEQGYQLMDEWSIPEIYCNIALNHHKEDFDPEDVLLLSVRIVNLACRKEGISTHPEVDVDMLTLPEVRALGIKGDVLDELDTIIAEAISSDFKG
ncbi:MAG: HDOD domain-containing protein [Syntrophobacteraceae bacterium]